MCLQSFAVKFGKASRYDTKLTDEAKHAIFGKVCNKLVNNGLKPNLNVNRIMHAKI